MSFQKERDHSAERRTLKRTADISKAMITRWVWRIDGLSKPAATFGGWVTRRLGELVGEIRSGTQMDSDNENSATSKRWA